MPLAQVQKGLWAAFYRRQVCPARDQMHARHIRPVFSAVFRFDRRETAAQVADVQTGIDGQLQQGIFGR